MVVSALNDIYTHYGKFVLVHGGCPSGADKIARDWFYEHGSGYTYYMDVFLADWDTYGNGAGPLRNLKMVNAGADVGLAFPLGDSRGTADCIRKMQAADIPVRIYDWRSGIYRKA